MARVAGQIAPDNAALEQACQDPTTRKRMTAKLQALKTKVLADTEQDKQDILSGKYTIRKVSPPCLVLLLPHRTGRKL